MYTLNFKYRKLTTNMCLEHWYYSWGHIWNRNNRKVAEIILWVTYSTLTVVDKSLYKFSQTWILLINTLPRSCAQTSSKGHCHTAGNLRPYPPSLYIFKKLPECRLYSGQRHDCNLLIVIHFPTCKKTTSKKKKKTGTNFPQWPFERGSTIIHW